MEAVFSVYSRVIRSTPRQLLLLPICSPTHRAGTTRCHTSTTMAGRKTRAAAKAQEESTSPSTNTEDNPLDLEEDQTLEQERDDETLEEDMSRPKSRKGGKNGAKKKAAKKAKVTLTPETTPEAETVEQTAASVVQDEEFNAAAMPILRSPKKNVEVESIGKCIASSHLNCIPNCQEFVDTSNDTDDRCRRRRHHCPRANHRSATSNSRGKADPDDETTIGIG